MKRVGRWRGGQRPQLGHESGSLRRLSLGGTAKVAFYEGYFRSFEFPRRSRSSLWTLLRTVVPSTKGLRLNGTNGLAHRDVLAGHAAREG